MRQLLWIAVIAIWACCAAAQTFTVVQNQPQAVTESPNATKGEKSKSKIDASSTTGDQMKKSRRAKPATSAETPQKSTVGNTANRETKNDTAGSIAGNANAVGRNSGQTRPSRHNKQQAPPPGLQKAQAQPSQPQGDNAPQAEKKAASHPAAMSGPAAPPYHAPAWLPQSPDSSTLHAQISGALTQDQSLVGSTVDVAVNDNEVSLAGTVPGSREKLAAERIARSFAGNRKVVNKLNVGAQPSQPANNAPQPAQQQKLNDLQPPANMPAASFAPQSVTHPSEASPSNADTVQNPATARDQSPHNN